MVDPVTLPTMTPVVSSNLAAIGTAGPDLFIQFKPKGDEPGAVWRYPGHAAHAVAMIAAESPGKYFHAAIKAARIEGERVA